MSSWRECGHEVSGTESECLHCRIDELEARIEAVKHCNKHYGFITGQKQARYYMLMSDVLAVLKDSEVGDE